MVTVELTEEQLEAVQTRPVTQVDGTFFKIGHAYLILCVTNFWTGRVCGIGDTELLLSHAAWIADTGRFADAFNTGELGEVEPVPGTVIVSRPAIVDAVEWSAGLPLEQK